MNILQFTFETVWQGYAPYLFDPLVLLVAAILLLNRPATRETSVGNQQEQQTENMIANQAQAARDPIQKLYGLVIGVDNYPSLGVLRGAVADANDITKFLTSDLCIPSDHIINLRNEQATRKAIIHGFQALWNNPEIQRGDPILIYYAGHGGLATANQGWKEKYGANQIQVIFPFDYQLNNPESANPVNVNCIPDKTIARLLNKLANEKGDNITVIFDSCHSASSSRDTKFDRKAKSIDRRARAANVELEIPHDIDDDIFALDDPMSLLPERQQRDAELLLCVDQTSHIHFAACGVRQKAFEENGQGVFTAALLKKIRESRVDNITYHNLMKSLEMSSEEQSPQCYGKHKNRKLFNSRISSPHMAFIPVNLKEGEFILAAGAASGVTVGSTWELYKSPTVDSPSVGKFKVEDLYGSVAILQAIGPVNGLPEGDSDFRWYARCIQVGPGNELKVWMSLDDRKLLFQDQGHVGGAQETGIGYVITATRDSADVALEVRYPDPVLGAKSTAQPEVVFYWCDPLAVKYGVAELKHRKPARREEVETVLFAAAKWRWHLRRGNSQGRLPEQGVTMSMLKVGNRVNRRRTYLLEPKPVWMNEDGAVDFVVEDSELHGFKLNSEIRWPLYVRMFYFDATDFSIGDMFGHNAAHGEGTTDIPARGQLLIGDGADGGTPIKFNIAPSNQIEIGYMKVFWSTEPLELDHVEQKSAFKMKPGEARGAVLSTDGTDSERAEIVGEWGTVCLALVLRETEPKRTISSSMSANNIMAILESHGCKNLTDQLEPDLVSSHPVCAGGYGDIYTGQLHGIKVAIKTARLHRNPDKHSLKETAKELYTFMRCQHPNILSLLGLAAFQGQIGIVSAWLENGDVRKYLLIRSETDRCKLCHGISDGLAYMHSAGVIHGDLKGANVLVSDSGIPVLSDFGNAVPDENSLIFTKSNTETGMSPRWTAPEILDASSSLSYAADVYALGMTWLEIITGEVPFNEIKHDRSLFFPIVHGRRVPIRPDTYIPSNSRDGEALWDLLLKCWAYMPKDRPSANESRDSIKKITQDGLIEY